MSLYFVYHNIENTHDWSIDKPEKADFEKDLTYMIDRAKLQPQFGPFLDFLDPSRRSYLGSYLTINFGFGSTSLSFVFNLATFGASFAFFLALWCYPLGPLRLNLGIGSGSKFSFGTY